MAGKWRNIFWDFQKKYLKFLAVHKMLRLPETFDIFQKTFKTLINVQ